MRLRPSFFLNPHEIRVKAVQQPVAIDRKLLYILPTRYGAILLLLLAAILIASVNLNDNVGYLMSFLLGSMAICSLSYTWNNLSGIILHVLPATPVFAGESARFNLIMKPGSRFRDNLQVSFGKEELIRFSCEPQAESRKELIVPFRKRGLRSPGILHVSSAYPLGLFSCGFNIAIPDLDTIVYPQPISDAHKVSLTKAHAAGDEPDITSQDDFCGLSQYQPGDEIRHIYWKAYSKGQGLYRKEMTETSGKEIMLDWQKISATDPEWKLSVLCSLVLELSRQDGVYGLLLPGVRIEADSGEVHRLRCLKALALFQQEG